MLQQTQTHRVEKKFEEFLLAFPTFVALADASTRDLLVVWQGLGYNRRALYLQQSAQKIVNECDGHVPNDPAILVTFPGIGKATAASICAFTFNNPTIFIETNIRAVFIDSFFKNQDAVHDNQLMPLIAATVDQLNPREWYYALMDYGVHLKKHCANPNKKSAHYAVQSKFEGSDRQIRGMILRLLTEKDGVTIDCIVRALSKDAGKIQAVVKTLEKDQFVRIVDSVVCLI
jgi:A/G-specific adenine glycosylase